MILTSDNPYRNNNLFSNYYLEKYIPESTEWKKKDYIAAFEQIKIIYTRESASIKTLNEKQLENHFFNEIFSILGFVYEVTEPTHARNFPDYAFFFDRNGLDDAHKNKETIPFFTNAVAIGEVKQWKVDLDKVSKNEYNISENPSLQIWTYLEDTEQKWGILTNGRVWRLYCKERRRDNYLEIDLLHLIESNDSDNFRFFYYFFRKDAFVKSKEGEAFLDRVLNESKEYAEKIGDDLKDNIYWAMKRIAEGFIHQKSNHLENPDAKTLFRVQNNTMILLYRFLFLLYAEGKNLLDLDDPRYREYYSFHHIKHEIKERQDGPANQRFDTVKSSIQADLKVLFKLVDQGSESFGIPKSEYYIPAYNGGLFDPEKHPDLEQWEIGDKYLADAIDLLSRSKPKDGHRDFIDYSTLEIRNLGSIYEGLLEYKLKIAESDLVVNNDDWVTLDVYNANRKQKKTFTDFIESDRVSKGHLYLATDKGERKSSGSYYTPDYIVNFIVKNTIGPVVEQKWKGAQERNESYVDAILSITILDPAMGSGHFLVGAVDFLSQKLLEGVQKDFETGKIEDTAPYTNDWARRDVVSHCIYGVDLNELAVELAKVGLWLTTISKDKPLSFLDHRLKQGNSLVGARLSDLSYYPHHEKGKHKVTDDQTTLKVSPLFINHLLGKINELDSTGDDTIADIKKKEKIFEEFKHLPEYEKTKAVANVYSSLFFDNVIDSILDNSKKYYQGIFRESQYNDDKSWKRKTNWKWFVNADEISKKYSFFHWELEYPEIFFKSGGIREDSGWDAVIGNPPYGLIKDKLLKEYIKNSYRSSEYQQEKYVVFIELARKLSKLQGYQSLIVPSSYLSMHYFSLIRHYILSNSKVSMIILFKYPIFEDPTVECSIYVCQSRIYGSNLEDALINCSIINDSIEFIYNQYRVQQILQKNFLQNPGYDFSINIESKDAKLIETLKGRSFPLKNICEMTVGIKPYQTGKGIPAQTEDIVKNRVFDSKFKKDQTYHRYLMGKDIGRFEVKPLEDRWLSYGNWLAEPRKSAPFFEPKRIIIRQTGDSIIAALEEHQYLTLNNIHNLKLKEVEIQYEYLLAILNSKISTYFHQKHVPEKDRTFAEVKIVDLEVQPIRNILFTTPVERRSSLLIEAKDMYQSFTKSNDMQHILSFVDTRLKTQPEESDVIHDLLAFLAEQMVEMNKEKYVEIKKFLTFIENEIGISIEGLSNKTLIQEYYATDFTKFIDVLVKNKSKMKEGYNPKSRGHYNILKDWYDSSVIKLTPLLMMIDATDSLIDQIVYKLYGLTDEDIAIIDGAEK